MYRIEVATGEETVFRTVEELATGIRNGLITPRSRIFHAASQKWLPIEFHPHYKKALDQVTGGAPMIDTGLMKPARRTPVPSPAPAPPTPAPAPRPEPWRAAASPPPQARQPAPAPTAAKPVGSAPLPPVPPPSARPSSYLPPEPAARPAPRAFEDLVPAAPAPAAIHAPAAVPAPAAPTSVAATAVVESAVLIEPAVDELELPQINYPDVPPPAESGHPVARRRANPRATLLIAGAVGLTALGGYFVTARSSAAAAPAVQPASETTDEQESQLSDGEGALPGDSEPAPAPTHPKPAAARPAPSRSSSAPLLPGQPGPAPATASRTELTLLPRPTGPVSQAWSSSAGAIAPVTPAPSPAAPASTASDVPAIAPAPIAIELAIPKLPAAETIGVAAEAKRDSLAMKRILRAVSGKPAGEKSGQR